MALPLAAAFRVALSQVVSFPVAALLAALPWAAVEKAGASSAAVEKRVVAVVVL